MREPRRIAALAAVLLMGCNEGGIMELELLLPPAPASYDLGACTEGDPGSCPDGTCTGGRCLYSGEWHSQVEITSQFEFLDPSGLVNQWDLGRAARVAAIPLPASSGDDRWSCTSVLGDSTVDEVRLRLRYCRSLPCVETLEGNTIEHWITIERPFYDSKRTYVRRRAPLVPSATTDCDADADCGSVGDGPVCLPSSRTCGCTDDSQCAQGHCEGAQTPAGEGRCTIDIERCRVAGCIVNDRLLDGPNLCLGLDTGSEEHPCEESPTVEYEPVNCFVTGE